MPGRWPSGHDDRDAEEWTSYAITYNVYTWFQKQVLHFHFNIASKDRPG